MKMLCVSAQNIKGEALIPLTLYHFIANFNSARIAIFYNELKTIKVEFLKFTNDKITNDSYHPMNFQHQRNSTLVLH